ncbi:heme peroxidase [Terramyces sp. JEL0728]|nr:heme peroxidase [Terramyces sp. JEL0728]
MPRDRPASKLAAEATVVPYSPGLKEFLVEFFRGAKLDVEITIMVDSVQLKIQGPSLVLPTALPYLQGCIANEFDDAMLDWTDLNLVGDSGFEGITVNSNFVQDMSELMDSKLQGLDNKIHFNSLDEFYLELQNTDLCNEEILGIQQIFSRNKIKVGHLAKLDRGFLKDCELPVACPYAGEHKIAKRSANWQINYKNTIGNSEWDQIKSEIQGLVRQGYGPLLVRLAWHDAGTYDASSGNGGPHATMRFAPVANYDANNGLGGARGMLAPIKDRHPGISYADLWSFAGAVSVSNIGGPAIQWRPGRNDAVDNTDSLTPDGRLPNADLGADHLRSIFYRMGFGDREIVALSGGHNLGATHLSVSGYDGQWTNNPGGFGNEFYVRLNNNFFSTYAQETLSSGKTQYHDSGNKMMLPTDVSLIQDSAFRGFVQTYAANRNAFYADFKSAFESLLELGVGGGLGAAVETRFGVPTTGHDSSPPPKPPTPQTTNAPVQTTVPAKSAPAKTTDPSTATVSAVSAVGSNSASNSAINSESTAATSTTAASKPSPNSAIKIGSSFVLLFSLLLL